MTKHPIISTVNSDANVSPKNEALRRSARIAARKNSTSEEEHMPDVVYVITAKHHESTDGITGENAGPSNKEEGALA
uniref:Uncharacterized protein n=1 Tax=Acrobeloides nanus TaxID=290746 RepID=A0A914C952_9BILA